MYGLDDRFYIMHENNPTEVYIKCISIEIALGRFEVIYSLAVLVNGREVTIIERTDKSIANMARSLDELKRKLFDN